jgi:hypothetical protein
MATGRTGEGFGVLHSLEAVKRTKRLAEVELL